MTIQQALAALTTYQLGIQPITDLGTMPASLVFLEPNDVPTVDTKVERIARDGVLRADGRYIGPIDGKQASSVSLALRLRGLSRGSDTAASTPTSTQTELANILTSLWGQDGQSQSGSTVSSSTTNTITVASASGFVEGGGVAVTIGGKLEVYTITGISSNTLTLDRDLSGTPSGNAIASATWWPKHDNTRHKHLALAMEGENYRTQVLGLLGSGSIDFGAGSRGVLSLSLTGTAHEHGAKEDPVFVAPTTGEDVVSLDCLLFVDGESYDALSASFDFGVETKPQDAITATNGHDGHRAMGKKPTLKVTLYRDATLFQALQSSGTKSVLLQVGRQRGAMAAVYFPAAWFDVSATYKDGQETMDLVCNAVRSSLAYDAALHLF